MYLARNITCTGQACSSRLLLVTGLEKQWK